MDHKTSEDKRYFLNIETSFSGQITGYRTAKSVEITNLEYPPAKYCSSLSSISANTEVKITI